MSDIPGEKDRHSGVDEHSSDKSGKGDGTHNEFNGNNDNSNNDNVIHEKDHRSEGYRPAGYESGTGYMGSDWSSNILMEAGQEVFYNLGLNNAHDTPSIHNTGYYSPNSNQGQNGTSGTLSLIPLGEPYEAQVLTNGSTEQKEESDTISQKQSGVSGNLSLIPLGEHFQTQAPADGNTEQKGGPKMPTKQRRPCDHCRRRKTKCVVASGSSKCAQCEAKSLPCTYVGLALKRKSGDVYPQNVKRSSSLFEGLSPIKSDKNAIIPPNVPIRDVPPVQDYSSMNNSLLKKTLSLQFPRSSFYVGPTSYLCDMSVINSIIDARDHNANHKNMKPGSKVEQLNFSESLSLRKVNDEVLFLLKDDQTPVSYQTMSVDVDKIEKFVAPHGQILIDLYFRIVHPSYPILHKKVFLEKYSRTHREFSAPLLAAVYALAIEWWDYDPQLNRYPKPQVELILRIGINSYLLEILKRPKLSAVQAGLLLLQCRHINREHKDDTIVSSPENNLNHNFVELGYSEWVLCCQVVALAEELGLGLDCHDWKLPKWERGLRKRLAWATYMEDKWLSLKHSRPSHILNDNWVVLSLVEEDFPEKHGDGDLKEGSSDIDNGKKLFMKLINLSIILSDIIAQFYAMRTISALSNIEDVLILAKPLQLRLREWYHSLPAELQMTSVKPRKLCSNGYLQLAYFATELTLHRKIILSLHNQKLAGNPPAEQLVSVCRSAAETRLLASIEFVRDLKPEHIHSFWHSSSSSNFVLIGTFASILFITSSSIEEADYYKDQIFNYRWVLKMCSKGFTQASTALQKLNLILLQIPGLFNDNVDLPMTVPYVAQDSDKYPGSSFNQESNDDNYSESTT